MSDLFDPITLHGTNTKYSSVIPEDLEIDWDKAMPEIIITDQNGDRLKLMLFPRQAETIATELAKFQTSEHRPFR